MDKLFYPESIAVAGVSDKPSNMARMIMFNLEQWKYSGKIYGINPAGGEVFGHKIYPKLTDIKGKVDVVAVLAPARTVPDLLDQAHEKGVEYMVIETAGFSEFSEEGAKLGELVKQKAADYGIKFVGPNGLGTMCSHSGAVLPFSYILPHEPGCVSIMSQSGGIGISIITGLHEHNLATSKFVSLGNKYSLDEVDFLEYFINDKETKIILCYLESINRGREFTEVAASSQKPILLCKASTTEVGARQAISHTAALVNDDHVLDAAMKQAGITRVERLDQLYHFARTFLQPPIKSNRISLATPAGGFAVLSADTCARYGFEFPDLAPATVRALQAKLRAGVINIGNPIDLGDALGTDTLLLAMDKTLAQDDIDACIHVSSRRPANQYKGPFKIMMRNPIPEIPAIIKKHNKPAVVAFIGAPELVREYRADSEIPVYHSVDLAIEALAAYRDFCTRPKPQAPSRRRPRIPAAARKRLDALEPGIVTGAAAFRVLRDAKIPVCEFREVATPEQAVDAAVRLGYPVAMKIDSPHIIHKTEFRALHLKLRSDREVLYAYGELEKVLQEHNVEGKILVQEMAGPGMEVIIGSKHDPQFGPVLMFGLGGVFVEVLHDVVFHLAPIKRYEALNMIDSIHSAPLLKGTRGLPPADIKALADSLIAVSHLIAARPVIAELDINPMIVKEKGQGCVAVDARFVLSEKRPRKKK